MRVFLDEFASGRHFVTHQHREDAVGFGGVLENLVKRIDRKASRACVQDLASFDAALESLAPDAS